METRLVIISGYDAGYGPDIDTEYGPEEVIAENSTETLATLTQNTIARLRAQSYLVEDAPVGIFINEAEGGDVIVLADGTWENAPLCDDEDE